MASDIEQWRESLREGDSEAFRQVVARLMTACFP